MLGPLSSYSLLAIHICGKADVDQGQGGMSVQSGRIGCTRLGAVPRGLLGARC